MAAAKAVTIGRSFLTFRSSSSHLVMSKRLFSSSYSIAGAPPLPGFSRPFRSAVSLSNYLRVFVARLNTIRCRVNHSGGAYSPHNSRRYIHDPTTFRVKNVFPGLDFEHWLIVMDNPGGEGATKQQMIDCYVEVLANLLGSEEEAKQKIYSISVSCERYFGFGCEIDEETALKLQELPGVLYVRPDSHVDPEYEDYGGIYMTISSRSCELFVNGKIVQRSPERKKRMEPFLRGVKDES